MRVGPALVGFEVAAPGMHEAACGKQVEVPYLGILRIAHGKISEMWVEWDNISMLTQFGHFSPSADKRSEWPVLADWSCSGFMDGFI